MYEYISVRTHPNSLQFIQEQDSHGGGFHINQCFVGMMSDVRMWNYVLSPCEIQLRRSELHSWECDKLEGARVRGHRQSASRK